MAETPAVQATDLFELYERDGSLLLVTSDRTTMPPLRRGDRIIRRRWVTGASPEFIKEEQ